MALRVSDPYQTWARCPRCGAYMVRVYKCGSRGWHWTWVCSWCRHEERTPTQEISARC